MDLTYLRLLRSKIYGRAKLSSSLQLHCPCSDLSYRGVGMVNRRQELDRLVVQRLDGKQAVTFSGILKQ